MIRCVDDLMPKKIVEVIFLRSTVMGSVGEHSMDTQSSLDVVDGVGWIFDVSNTWSRGCVLVDRGSRCYGGCGS